ncbi:type VI secretion system tip protein TssI/VgrG [Desulfococcaceae bacterium HSG7]|nr:type VI secretion system tip protein TssI/VgrG [Desulfococcaceae bacterium HSG7]
MPSFLTQKKFDFVSSAMPKDTFAVAHFKGFEGFSICYEFEIMLVAADAEIDLTAVLEKPVTFTILRDDGDIPFHGILTQFEQLQNVDDFTFYRAVLVPKLWWLSLTHHNQIFLDKTVPEIIEDVLKDGGLSGNDFELKLQNSYPEWEFVCQYKESHLNFVSRWMEREGMYYYFEQTGDGEKVIITDTGMAHVGMAEGKTMTYSPPSGLDEPYREEVIHAFICRQKLLPKKLHIKDYNYRTPLVPLSAETPVLDQGRGEVHVYGEHFKTPAQGTSLAKIRAEELLSHEKRFIGESTIPYLRPGYRFDLERHYRDSFNQEYLTITLEHAGSQTGYLIAGIKKGLSEIEKRPYYRNSFVVIPAEVQYRHPKKSEKPLFSGVIHALIDAEGSGEYAQLDDQGRYKVILPFDLSGRREGKASHWIRMAQPYGGENQGMHFPLHKHTEVLLTFIEGDPDRPIIASVAPNPETPGPVTSANQMKSIIKTGRGPKTHSVGASLETETAEFLKDNFIELDDEEGKERIITHTPGDLWLESNWGLGHYYLKNPQTDCALPENLFDRDTVLKKMLSNFGDSYNPGGLIAYGKHSHFRVSNFDTFNTQEGNIYDFGGYWNYNLGNSYEENHMDQDDSITLNSDEHPRDKAAKGGPTPGEIDSKELGTLTDSTWIGKTIKGASYDYTYKTKSLEVEYETMAETQTYGKKEWEYHYDEDGTKLEHTFKKYRNKSIEEVTKTYHTKTSLDIHKGGQASSEINLGGQASSEINIGAQASSEINVGAIAAFSLEVAGSATIDLTVAATFGISLGVAAGFKLSGILGGEYEYNLVTKQFDAKMQSFKAQKAAVIEAKQNELELKNGLAQIEQNTTNIGKNVALIRDNHIAVLAGFLVLGVS